VFKQDINRQIRELKKAGAEQIIFEYEHGDAKVKQRQEEMLEEAKQDDTIITLEVPRLARSTQQLCEIIDKVSKKKLRLVIVGSITLDCRNGQTDPMSEAFLQMAGVFSQLELAMIRARVKSGMENAKAKGKKIGRPPVKGRSYYLLPLKGSSYSFTLNLSRAISCLSCSAMYFLMVDSFNPTVDT